MKNRVRLGDIARIYSGGTPSRTVPAYWNGKIPWVKTTQIQNCVIAEDDIDEWITDEGLNKSSAKIVPKGTVLIAMIGQGKTRGQVAILDLDATTNQNAAAIQINESYCRDYIYQQLLFRYQEIRNISNSSGQQNLNLELIKSIAFPCPSLPEQTAIANLLSTWDTAIEKIERLIAAKEKRLSAFYQQYFKPNSSKNGSWIYSKLKNFLHARKERIVPSDEFPLYSLTIENGVTEKTDRYNRDFLVKNSETKQYKIVYPGDIVFNPANLRWGAIARSEVRQKVTISPIYEVLKFKSGSIDPDFLTHAITCSRQIGIFATKTEGTLIERMAVKLDVFLLTEILHPIDIKAQKRISATLNTARYEIDLLKKQLDAYRRQKRGLMQKLLTGQWRVKVKEN